MFRENRAEGTQNVKLAISTSFRHFFFYTMDNANIILTITRILLPLTGLGERTDFVGIIIIVYIARVNRKTNIFRICKKKVCE